MFKLLYGKFIQDNVYQMLSESTEFCGRYDKNILVCFSVDSVDPYSHSDMQQTHKHQKIINKNTK